MDRIIALTAAGVTVLLEAPGDALPSIAYWGPELPGLDATQAAELLRALDPVTGTNDIARRPRTAVLPSHATGWTGRPGLSGSASGAGWSPSFQPTSLYATAPSRGSRGETRDEDLAGASFIAGGPGRVEAEAVDDSGRLGLRLEIELLDSGLLRARAEVGNRSADPYELHDLVLSFPVPDEASEILDFAGRHNLERVPQRSRFGVGTHLRENRKGRTGADSAYVLHAGTPGFGFASGRIWAVHTAWSGNHTHYAERVFTGEQRIGGGELLLPGEVRLGEGESYRGPWVYGAYGEGLDRIARRFHRHVRSRPRPVGTRRPVTLNVWEAVYFDHDAARLIDLAGRAAEAGVERFVLDDGWFGSRRDDTSGLGDWVVSPDAWPDGLHPLVDRVRELGMQFGLWFEPEMVNPDSELARAHPDWIMAARASWPVESRHQQVLNLGIPAAYAHVRDQILAILGEYDIGYLKWDHNRDLIEAGNQLEHGRAGVHEQTLAFYRLLDEIRAAHPTLEIESCSSGGARVDLEVLERADRVWVSDNIDPHDRQSMLRWTTQLVPPEIMGSHIASGRSHETGRRHDLGFRAGTAIFGHLGIEWDLAHVTPAELTELTEWVTLFKENRDLLLGGDLVRMDGYPPALLVHGVVAADRSRAIFAMVTLDSPYPDPPSRLRFRGLDPARLYRVRPIRPTGIAPPWWSDAPPRAGAVQPGAPPRAGAVQPGAPPRAAAVQPGAPPRAAAVQPGAPPRAAAVQPGATFRAGAVLSGAALEHVGVACPRVHPDQVVLYRADAEG
ncbi:alpha-galactosidase [Actinoplanes sp. CA-030573]|uniref:alpha-galactosidase n=1 Tax=Actinoplanes sp. CA-030573 TaxID=3239898 RepID=UPI003D93C6EC